MPRHFEKKILPFKAMEMFDLVADIERYPEFLPWCHSAKIYERKGNIVKADLIVGTKWMQNSFVSEVILEKPEKISVNYVAGPLRHLKNEWTFIAINKNKCELSFFVDFAFQSAILSSMMNVVFDKAFRKMAQAFEERAHEIYG